MRNDPGSPTIQAAKQASTKAGALVENWISIPSWYVLLKVIALAPGTPLQRVIRARWDASA